jgi:hypothetical protein
MHVKVPIRVGWGSFVDVREAIPVRALPFVSSSTLDPLSPYRIASDLASPQDVFDDASSPDINPRVLTGLRAYQLTADHRIADVLPMEWDRIAERL